MAGVNESEWQVLVKKIRGKLCTVERISRFLINVADRLTRKVPSDDLSSSIINMEGYFSCKLIFLVDTRIILMLFLCSWRLPAALITQNAAFHAIVQVIDFLDEATIKTTIIPKTKQVFESNSGVQVSQQENCPVFLSWISPESLLNLCDAFLWRIPVTDDTDGCLLFVCVSGSSKYADMYRKDNRESGQDRNPRSRPSNATESQTRRTFGLGSCHEWVFLRFLAYYRHEFW